MIDVSIALALGAGLLSFLSPCVLPLIPGYLSFISGAGTEEIKTGSRRAGVFYRTLFFVLGFSAVFVGLGLAFSGGGMLVAGRSTRLVSVLAGSIITLFGLNTIFNFVRLLNTEVKAHVSARPTNAAGAFVVGMAFGAGWTPVCWSYSGFHPVHGGQIGRSVQGHLASVCLFGWSCLAISGSRPVL
ncbi:hypothetical protein MASR2M48_18110 [Spirochaetota bacterium]